MAQRYGGKYSPGPQGSPGAPVPPMRRTRVGLRVNLLFVAPLPLILRAFALDATGLVLTLVGLALLLGAAWMTREGELAQEAYEERKVARRPSIPRKLFGSVLTGLGIGAACLPGAGLLGPVLLGLLGAALHLASFGPDPLRDKGMDGIDLHEQDRASRAVTDAEVYLTAMREAILRARDRTLDDRVARFSATARAMFRQVQDDPRDLVAAKKYLTVYLMGARDATVKFADLYARGHDAGTRAEYETLLDDLETRFASKTKALMNDDRDDLDIEIGVLRERLEREGVKAG